MPSAHEDFADLHADILGYSRGLERDARRRVLAIGDEIAVMLAGLDLSKLSRRQLDALIRRIAAQIDAGYAGVAGAGDVHIDDLLKVVTPAIARRVKSRVRTAPSTKDVLIGGVTMAEAWTQAAQNMMRSVRRALRMAAVGGLSDATAAILGRGGVIEKSAKGAVIGAQGMAVAAETQAQIAVATETSLIKGFRSSAMFDAKTCLICAAMDGEEFDRDGVARNEAVRGVGKPAYHPNCRCAYIPILSDEEPAAAIPGPDGKVSTGITFEQFVETKSEKWKRDYFGPGRYELYKKGKITLNDLVNGQGKVITLEDLRDKYGE